MKKLVSAAFLMLEHCSQFDNAYVELKFDKIPRIQVAFTVQGRKLGYIKAYTQDDLYNNEYLTPEYIYSQYLRELPSALIQRTNCLF